MPPPTPRAAVIKPATPSPHTEPTASETVKESPAAPAPVTEHAPAVAPWSRQFDTTWNVIGHALHLHLGVELNRATTTNPKHDWWVISGDLARAVLAVYRKDWVALSLAVEQLLRDLGIEATAEQLRGISRALAATADTLSLNSASPPPPSPAVDNAEKTK